MPQVAFAAVQSPTKTSEAVKQTIALSIGTSPGLKDMIAAATPVGAAGRKLMVMALEGLSLCGHYSTLR